jgi:hypothetical protein
MTPLQSAHKRISACIETSLPESQDDRRRCPETGSSLLLRVPKLGALQRRLVKRRHLLRHVKRLLRCAQAAYPQLRAAYSRLRLKQRVLRSEDRSAIW